MVESARKHGPFDLRYPARRKIAASVWELRPGRDGPGRLEWSGFVARCFRNRRRHDFEALASFEAYGSALDRAALLRTAPTMRSGLAKGGEAQRGVAASPSPPERIPARSDTGRIGRSASTLPALMAWEWEGGSVGRE